MVEFESGDYCYRIEFLDAGDSVQWADAKKLCESEEGRMLVEVYTEEIRNELYHKLDSKYDTSIVAKKINGFWIGLVRGKWLWHDGKDFVLSYTAVAVSDVMLLVFSGEANGASHKTCCCVKYRK